MSNPIDRQAMSKFYFYLETGDYSITPSMFSNNCAWLENKEDEGLEIGQIELMLLLDKAFDQYFKENF